MVMMLSRKLLTLSVIILIKDVEVSCVFSPFAPVTTFWHPSDTLLYEQ
jgi:hypothetical protein